MGPEPEVKEGGERSDIVNVAQLIRDALAILSDIVAKH